MSVQRWKEGFTMASWWHVAAGIGLLVAFVFVGLGMLVVALRFGPRRGTWNQPAARFREPGVSLRWTMYLFGLAHVGLGVVAMRAVGDQLAWGVLAVSIGAGAFYVACGKSLALATALSRRTKGDGEPAAA